MRRAEMATFSSKQLRVSLVLEMHLLTMRGLLSSLRPQRNPSLSSVPKLAYKLAAYSIG